MSVRQIVGLKEGDLVHAKFSCPKTIKKREDDCLSFIGCRAKDCSTEEEDEEEGESKAGKDL